MKFVSFLILLFSISFFSCKNDKPSTQQGAQKQGGGETLKVQGIIAGQVSRTENITTTGTVLPGEKVDIKSEISGRVVQMNFKEGTFVKKGQTLVKLDDATLQAEKKEDFASNRTGSDQRKRQKQLLSAKAISQEEYDLTEANLNILKSNVDIINTQIAETVITAPFQGVVGFRNISIGAMITPADVITTLHSIQPVKIEFSVPERWSKDLKTGQSISFTISSDKKVRKANIYAIDPQINPNNRSLVLRAMYPNPGGEILPGAFTDIKIAEGIKGSFVAIPSMAYVPDISGALVYLQKEGKVIPVKVIAASRSESEVFLESGVTPGDTVITTGLLQLKPGMPVQVLTKEN
ncbi:MAG: efflux RND transporter periplasmic adaptor subunit [Saprospiraceae bacterium]|nr:efflux RND transporter periplasmic adaptor subunit [Saprospiraceae bacterium]